MTVHEPDPTQTLLMRNGHLTELSVDRYIQGELDDASQKTFVEHLENCSDCTARLEQINAFDRDLASSPLFAAPPDFAAMAERNTPKREPTKKPIARPPSRTPRPLTAPRRSRMFQWAGGAAAAVALMVGVIAYTVIAVDERSPNKPNGTLIDDITVKGGSELFTLEIHRKGSSGSDMVMADDAVHPGDELGFVVLPKNDGYVVVAGVDKTHKAYPCVSATGTSVAVKADTDGSKLLGAIQLDSVLGEERIVAVFCAEPFAFDAIKGTLEKASQHNDVKLPLLRDGCTQYETVLTKTARK